MQVRALLWTLVGLGPLHRPRLLVFNQVAKDPALAIMTRHLPLETDRVFGFVVGLWGDWGTGRNCRKTKHLASTSMTLKTNNKIRGI